MVGVGAPRVSRAFGRRLAQIGTAERPRREGAPRAAAPKEARRIVPSLTSTVLWLIVIAAIYFGGVYVKTRYVCQSFKDTGRFYYGMDVQRCIGVLIDEPFHSMNGDLEKLNRSYAIPPKR